VRDRDRRQKREVGIRETGVAGVQELQEFRGGDIAGGREKEAGGLGVSTMNESEL
jgi:hypothetical protein